VIENIKKEEEEEDLEEEEEEVEDFKEVEEVIEEDGVTIEMKMKMKIMKKKITKIEEKDSDP